jgi:hypothetical protein
MLDRLLSLNFGCFLPASITARQIGPTPIAFATSLITFIGSSRIWNRPPLVVIAVLAAAMLYFLQLGVKPHLPPFPEAVR